jgi:hypothetical protein
MVYAAVAVRVGRFWRAMRVRTSVKEALPVDIMLILSYIRYQNVNIILRLLT